MKKEKLPEVLYVRKVKDGDCTYFESYNDPNTVAVIGEKILIGVYKLEETRNLVGDWHLEDK